MTLAVTAGQAVASDIAHGNFMGSGRACYGMLTITARAITWMTPFSQCRTSTYTLVDRQEGPRDLRITYQLTRPSAGCRYSVLVLTHDVTASRDVGWNVAGYPLLAVAAEGRHDEAPGCYLYKQ